MKKKWIGGLAAVALVALSLLPMRMTMAATFGEDVEFLSRHTEPIVLQGKLGKARIVVSGKHQGRVYTSTAMGDEGFSIGWINYDLIKSGENNLHINAYGGEDRFWLGPEGGQFSIFFKKDDPFDMEHWFTPPALNEEPFDVVSKNVDQVHFRKTMHLTNYSGAEFDLEVNRVIRMLNPDEIKMHLGVSAGEGATVVAYESSNRVTNTGSNAWKKETGLLSIWILGMFNPSALTTVIAPFKSGPESELGPIVNDNYFGKVPASRLAVGEDVIYFQGDGKVRGKIGLTPQRAKPIIGSYDGENFVLTVVQYTMPKEAGDYDYVNSMWEIQDKPYAGDAVNSYNDGPPEPGAKALGPFYELESSSPAAALASGDSINHIHRTFHFQGSREALSRISRATLGVSLGDIKRGLGLK